MTEKIAPVLFVGHGSPMNALADNAYTLALKNMRALFPSPKAILCISAHWMTEQLTAVTHMAKPKTIHDFYGFPQELFSVEYPAPGAPRLAERIVELVPEIVLDQQEWGLDHGTWSVLRHMFPDAKTPVMQLSMDMSRPPEFHFELGRKLRQLRREGIFMIGSGNLVHNLRRLDWETKAPAFPWASEFNQWIKERLAERDFSALVHDFASTEAGNLSVPTPDHYYPFLYCLGAAEDNDLIRMEYDEIQNASISMLSVSFGV